jgi:hypothetical protein
VVSAVFDEVRLRFRKRVKCPRCGKPVARQTTLWQTANPWNKDPETGLPRTRHQILVALQLEGNAWMKVPELCRTCDEATK